MVCLLVCLWSEWKSTVLPLLSGLSAVRWMVQRLGSLRNGIWPGKLNKYSPTHSYFVNHVNHDVNGEVGCLLQECKTLKR